MEVNDNMEPAVLKGIATVHSAGGALTTAQFTLTESSLTFDLAMPLTIPIRRIETVNVATSPEPANGNPLQTNRIGITYLGENSARLLTIADMSATDAGLLVKFLLTANVQVFEQVLPDIPAAQSGLRGTAFLPTASGPFETAEWSAENGFFTINSTSPVGIPLDKIAEVKVITTIVRTGKKPDNIPLTMKMIEVSYTNDSGEKLMRSFMLNSPESEALVSSFEAGIINVTKEERVDLRFEYAGFWRRLVASLVDGLILNTISSAILIALTIIATLIGISSEQKYGTIFLSNTMFIANVAGLVYYLLFWSKGGQTPGKMALGLKIVTAEGKGISIGRAILRYFGYLVSTLMLGIGYLWITWDKKKQAVHDKIAGSYVIKV